MKLSEELDAVIKRLGARVRSASINEFRRWRDMAIALEATNERLQAVVDEYRGRGYHASMERCPHGISHWIGDHCAFDSNALTALEEHE